MDLTSVGGELMECSRKEFFWAFRFISAVLYKLLKLKRIVSHKTSTVMVVQDEQVAPAMITHR